MFSVFQSAQCSMPNKDISPSEKFPQSVDEFYTSSNAEQIVDVEQSKRLPPNFPSNVKQI